MQKSTKVKKFFLFLERVIVSKKRISITIEKIKYLSLFSQQGEENDCFIGNTNWEEESRNQFEYFCFAAHEFVFLGPFHDGQGQVQGNPAKTAKKGFLRGAPSGE